MFRFFASRRDWGAVAIRLFVGTFLIYMIQDNLRSSERMVEFATFLQRFGFPFPLVSAHVSVYAQTVGAVCLLVGFLTRPAAALIAVNFVVALAMVHTKLPFREALDPSAMLASAIFLLFHGPGPLSVDRWLESRRAGRAGAGERARAGLAGA